MATMIQHQYTGKARELYEEAIREAESRHGEVQLDTFYTYKNTFFKINQKGYIHFYKPRREHLGDKTYHTLIDYLLTDNNKLKEIGPYGRRYTDKEEFISFIMSL